MAYGTIKVDTITFTNSGSDQSITVSGIVQSISGNITATGTIQGQTIIGTSTVSGAIVTGDAGLFTTLTGSSAGFTTVTGTTVTGTTANFNAGTFTSQVSGATVTGNLAQFTTLTGGAAGFTSITGTTVTGTTANFVTVSGTTVTGNAGQFTTITGGSAGFTSITGATVTGTVGNFGAGSAAAPAVSVGTTDNGIYSPGADQLALSTNGTGRLFVDASGNVGVGLATPAPVSSYRVLHLRGGTTTNGGMITLDSSDGSKVGRLYAGSQVILDNSASSTDIYLKTNTANSILFGTNNTERLRITSGGLVGIGTSSPAELLHVEGASSPTIRIRTSTLGSNASPASAFLSFNGFNQEGRVRFEAQDRRSSVNGGFLNIATANASNVLTNALHINNAQQVGIGTTSPGSLLELSGSSSASELRLRSTDTTNATIRSYVNSLEAGKIAFTSGRELVIETAGAERARIDSSGRLLVGTSSARSNFFNAPSTVVPTFQLEEAGTNKAFASFVSNRNDTGGSALIFGKTRGTAVGSNAVVSSGDDVGAIFFSGADGGELVNAASIVAQVDGTPGANDMPGRLVFSTTADGASSPTERLRINNVGQTMVNSAGTAAAPVISKVDDPNTGIFFPAADTIAFAEGGVEAARITSDGRLLVGATSSTGDAKFEVTETRRLSASQSGSGWFELTDSAAVTSGTLTNIATVSLGTPMGCYFRLEVFAGHTDANGGYSHAVSIREGLISNYAASPRVLSNTETRNLSGSVNAGVIATAVTTTAVTGTSGATSTIVFRATATMSGSSSAGTTPRISYRLSLLSLAGGTVTAASNI